MLMLMLVLLPMLVLRLRLRLRLLLLVLVLLLLLPPLLLTVLVALTRAGVRRSCHAPTCLAMEIWNNRTGELVCRQEPIYGGTGKIDLEKFDEPGYILQPPCLWGEDPALEPMPLASGVPFMIKAITNSTYNHHGEMAFPEVTLAPWKNTSAFAPRQ